MPNEVVAAFISVYAARPIRRQQEMNIGPPLGLGLGVGLHQRRRLLDNGVVELIDGVTLVQHVARKNPPDRGGDDGTVGGDEPGDGADAHPGAHFQQECGSSLLVYGNSQHRSPHHPQTTSPGQHGNRAQKTSRHGDKKRGQDGVPPGNSMSPSQRHGRPAAGISTLRLFLLGKLQLGGTAVRAEQFGCAERRATSMAEQVHPF